MDYKKSVQLALALGFTEVLDPNGYLGKYFIKNDIIWIHDISALKAKLYVNSDDELRSLNYDVDTYYRYEGFTNEMADAEMKLIYNDFKIVDGEPTYLSDGMWLYPDGSIEER